MSGNDIEFTADEGLPENKLDQFYDYQRQWNEGNDALLSFECFCNIETEAAYSVIGNREFEDTVTIRLSVNFKDAPYYREKYATDLYSTVLTIDEFMTMYNQDIIDGVNIDRSK